MGNKEGLFGALRLQPNAHSAFWNGGGVWGSQGPLSEARNVITFIFPL